MLSLSDHLLRTLAPVSTSNRILVYGCTEGRHVEEISRLGFDVFVCDPEPENVGLARALLVRVMGKNEAEKRVRQLDTWESLDYREAHFDWVVAWEILSRDTSTYDDLLRRLAEVRRVLKPGGWVYLVAPAIPEEMNPNDPVPGYASDSGPIFTFTVDTLRAILDEAGLSEAEKPRRDRDGEREVLRTIFRRVDPGVVR